MRKKNVNQVVFHAKETQLKLESIHSSLNTNIKNLRLRIKKTIEAFIIRLWG